MGQTNKDILAYLSFIKNGEWDEIFKVIKNKESINTGEIEDTINRITTDFITLVDDNYPISFKRKLNKPPFVLFYKGDLSLIYNRNKKRLSVVGSRNATNYGCDAIRKIISELPKDYIIISGLATGIDAAAHQAALDNGLKTIAILGSGIDYIYPSKNKELYNNIIKNGGLIISEYPNSTIPKRDNFVFRNRIVAGLGNFLLVGEAYERSGTSTTINYAIECGNNVGCIPYPITYGSMCNKYIKEGAYLIENAHDIEEIMLDEGVSY